MGHASTLSPASPGRETAPRQSVRPPRARVEHVPDQAPSSDRAPLLEALDPDQGLELLKPDGVGSFAFAVAEREDHAIRTLNFVVIDDDIVFPDPSIGPLAGPAACYVSVQVRGGGVRRIWSVLARGTAREVRDPRETDLLTAVAHVRSWTNIPQCTYVRLTPTEVSGRQLRETA